MAAGKSLFSLGALSGGRRAARCSLLPGTTFGEFIYKKTPKMRLRYTAKVRIPLAKRRYI